MDDSSPNDPGIQQKPIAETTGNYPQYPTLTPEPAAKPRKRRKLVIVIAAAALALLVLVLLVLFIQNRHGRSAACTDEKCFSQHFSQCSPATYTFTDSNSSIKYAITGRADVGCTVTTYYLKAKFSADAVGKIMTCNFDNKKDFQTAVRNAFNYPADYECTGNLADWFKSVNDATVQP